MKSMKYNLEYRDLEVEINVKKVKNVSLRVEAGNIYLNIPYRKNISEKRIYKMAKDFIDEKYTWIVKAVAKTEKQIEKHTLDTLKFSDKDKLKIFENKFNLIYLNDDIFSKINESLNKIKNEKKRNESNENIQNENLQKISRYLIFNYAKFEIYINVEKISDVNKYLKDQLTKILKSKCEKLITKWEIILKTKSSSLKITNGKGNWGSCNTKKGYINLNFKLVHKNYDEIEYVVLHELCHLFHPNHGREFKAMLNKYMPDWKERKKRLNNLD